MRQKPRETGGDIATERNRTEPTVLCKELRRQQNTIVVVFRTINSLIALDIQKPVSRDRVHNDQAPALAAAALQNMLPLLSPGAVLPLLLMDIRFVGEHHNPIAGVFQLERVREGLQVPSL